jgi:hypothetical protein
MPDYRRNTELEKQIAEKGITFGLPLFQRHTSQRSANMAQRFEGAPSSVALATDTRKLSHLSLQLDEKKLGEKQMAVFRVIAEHGPVSNEEIADILHWRINRVVGRTFELRHIGKEGIALVVPAGKRKCTITGELVQTWKMNEVYKIENINQLPSNFNGYQKQIDPKITD